MIPLVKNDSIGSEKTSPNINEVVIPASIFGKRINNRSHKTYGKIFGKPESLGYRKNSISNGKGKSYLFIQKHQKPRITSEAMGGWIVTAAICQSTTLDVGGKTIELGENGENTISHFAEKQVLSVEDYLFPGTNLLLRAQEFRFINLNVDGKPIEESREIPAFKIYDGNCKVESIEEGSELGAVLRFKTSHYNISDAYGTHHPVLGDFSVFIPENATEIHQAFAVGHGVIKREKPSIPISSIPEGVVISYFGQPGKILLGQPASDLRNKSHYLSVKRDNDGFMYVKRSGEAKKIGDNWETLFNVPINSIPNIHMSKISPSSSELSTGLDADGNGFVLPGLITRYDEADTSSLCALSKDMNALISTPRRKGYRTDSEDFIKVISNLNKSGCQIDHISFYGCMQQEDSQASRLIHDAVYENKADSYILDDFNANALSSLPTHPLRRNSNVQLNIYRVNENNKSASSIGKEYSYKIDNTLLDNEEWELVDASGRFLENTEQNKRKVEDSTLHIRADFQMKNSKSIKIAIGNAYLSILAKDIIKKYKVNNQNDIKIIKRILAERNLCFAGSQFTREEIAKRHELSPDDRVWLDNLSLSPPDNQRIYKRDRDWSNSFG